MAGLGSPNGQMLRTRLLQRLWSEWNNLFAAPPKLAHRSHAILSIRAERGRKKRDDSIVNKLAISLK